jgi:hypothetical protein
MADEAKEAFKKVGLGSENNAYDIIAKLDPEYFEKLKGLYVDEPPEVAPVETSVVNTTALPVTVMLRRRQVLKV